MNPKKTILPFGLWPSPLSPTLISAAVRLNDVQWAPGRELLVWSQSQGGRTSLWAREGNDAPWNLSADQNPAGGIGYGGGDFCAGPDGVAFADRDGALYYSPYTRGLPRALTPRFGRCASPVFTPDGQHILYVHTYENHDVLAITDLNGKAWPRIFAQGADFYMQPTFSPDGKTVAWVEWDHPNMPWDEARLMLGILDPSGERLTEMQVLDGGDGVPTFQPAFSPDGQTLAYLANRGEWDELVLADLPSLTKRMPVKGRFLLPPAWVQGQRTLAWHPDGRSIFFIINFNGTLSLKKLELSSGHFRTVQTGQFTHLSQISVSAGGQLALLAESPQLAPRVIILDGTHQLTAARSRTDTLPAEDLPDPVDFSWQSSDGVRVHGLYFPPTSSRFTAEGIPPAVIYVHGGPTSQVFRDYNLDAAFFTSRGYAYFAVNYRGSSGYGRSYRQALYRNWGSLDLQDTIEGTRALIQQGLADRSRLAIKGSSAGGFTVLNALVHFPGFFRAAICSYGISNLFTMEADPPKFESHYNASLLGPLPEAAPNYREWSAIFHAAQIRDPLAIFQGSEDPVVPVEQAESIVRALQSNHVPHVYRLYEGEGHGFRKAENLKDYYQTVESFLKQYLIFSSPVEKEQHTQ